MADRYFVDMPIQGGLVTLKGPELHHLLHVMRAKPGAEVELFDGTGTQAHARLESIGRSEAQLSILNRQIVDRELSIRVVLGVSLPKGDRQRWLVEKAVELGVSEIVPFVTERSTVRPDERSLERLRRAVVEASKQCGRNRLLEIAAVQSWHDFVGSALDADLRLAAHPLKEWPESVRVTPASLQKPAPQPKCVWLAIGPEGGLTPDEVSCALAAGWSVVDLGARTLRVETAALFLVSLVVYAFAAG